MLNALLVDLDANAISNLEMLLNANCPQVTILGKATTLRDARQILLENEPDLIFTEIDLPKKCGFELTSENNNNCEFIIVTKNPGHAIEAIEKQVIGFLTKPVEKDKLMDVIKRAEEKIEKKKLAIHEKILLEKYESSESQNITIGIPTIEGYELIKVKDIIRCEGMQNCTRIVTLDRSDIISSYNLGKFIRLLEDHQFFSPHKSYLVNLSMIKKYLREGSLIMADGSYVPVSKRRKKELVEKIRLL